LAMRDGARRMAPGFRACQSHVDAHLARLDATLAKQPFLVGNAPCIADFAVFASVWFLETLAPEPAAGYRHLLAWSQRIRAIPAAPFTELSSADALAIARSAPTSWT